MLLLQAGTNVDDLVDDVDEAARAQRLLGHTDIRAPVDDEGRVRLDEVAAGEVPVEHDDDRSEAGGPFSHEPSTGRDVHRLADLVQHDAVRRGEGLERRDARNDNRVHRPMARQTIDDADRRVVERGVTPDEKSDDDSRL